MDKIPVLVISGFLGSGKTTLLLHLLEELKKKQITPGIVLNEIGQIHVEQHHFKDSTFMELLNGCICCSINDDLTMELAQFVEANKNVDMLIIEGTGVANPFEILDALSHPSLIDKVTVQSIVTVVDSSRFLEYQSIFASSKEIRKILTDQVAASTVLVLNKVDLVSQSDLLKIKKKISNIASDQVELLETSHSEIDVEILLSKTIHTIVVPARGSSCESSDPAHIHGPECSHHHDDHKSIFQTIRIEDIPILSKKRLEKWIKLQPKTLIRAKGIIQLEDQRMVEFQYASGKLNFSPIPPGDYKKGIVLIGTQLSASDSIETFQNLFLVKS